MTATDDQPAETMTDLLAALQASIDRARGTTVTDQPAPAKRRTGRPPLTDAAALLDAADHLGYPGLTVGAVTRHVGVKYSTFYRHYPSLEALAAALVDRHLHGIADAVDPDTGWREHLRQLVVALVALVDRHPGIDRTLITLPGRPDALTDLMVTASGVLVAHGAEPEPARAAVRALVDLVILPRPAAVADDPFEFLRDRLTLAVDGFDGIMP